ncbi:FecR domain-containing protein [Mucilaginibacter mali]|uniref:FecR domain-containing protein n=1 Tax=Mucilaginibacter mali TaxID=2740462 RepID=A0A7D4UKR5_9SPHI|nr:FecR family protein [Mucilaginibacter mali]QKJ31042.1 FecR domain-containing protein [Mucilaginibacter mali]
MFRKKGPPHTIADTEAHFQDEKAMKTIEKDMLRNIHRQIGYGPALIRSKKFWYAAAASILMCCSAAWLLMNDFYGPGKMLTVSSRKGHITTVILPDGSSAWLNSGAVIQYPERFSDIREIQLINGEAFFDVKHDQQHPFIVRYGSLHTQVLGTAFNVKYYPKLTDVRVTVVNGLVAVGDNTKLFTMIHPDNEIIYDQHQHTYKLRTINAQKVAAWRNREMNLYDVPFEDMIVCLENAYNVKVDYDRKKMEHTIVTIHFSGADDMEQVLKIIKTIYSLHYNIKGKEVRLY